MLNFALRTVFLYFLGKEYAGINGVLSGVLQVLNLANLGIDGAIVYAMYKPLAEKNIDQSKTLVAFYRKAYRLIGFLILAVGLALIPVLPYLLKDSTELVDIRVVYCLYLADTAASYWYFSYLTTVLQADQRKYVMTRVTYFTQIASTAARTVVLFAMRGTPVLCLCVHRHGHGLYGCTKSAAARAVPQALSVAEREGCPPPYKGGTRRYFPQRGRHVLEQCLPSAQ